MIGNDRVLAVIPARGGSKGVPRKNLRILGDRPLIAWTILAARASATVDRVVVSTDDPEIAAAATAWGADVPFRRPEHLASDHAPGDAPFRHAVGEVPGFDIGVLLQPTSPLRSAADIDACVGLAHEADGPVVSVTESAKHPAWMFTLDGGRMTPILPHLAATTRRQELSPAYALNGAVYVMKVSDILAGASLVSPHTTAYIMPPDRSIDIDVEADFVIASSYVKGERN